MLPGPPPQAVVVDLDDTVFPQAVYLDGAARAVGRAGAAVGLDGPAVTRALRAQLRAGSDRGGTIDRALAVCGVPPERAAELVPALVAAFIGYRPRRLPVFPRARYFAPRGEWDRARERSPRDAVSYIDSNYDPLIESGRMLTQFQSLLRTTLSAGIQAILGHTDNFNGFIALKLTAGLMKSQYLPSAILTHILPLSLRP